MFVITTSARWNDASRRCRQHACWNDASRWSPDPAANEAPAYIKGRMRRAETNMQSPSTTETRIPLDTVIAALLGVTLTQENHLDYKSMYQKAIEDSDETAAIVKTVLAEKDQTAAYHKRVYLEIKAAAAKNLVLLEQANREVARLTACMQCDADTNGVAC